VTVVYFSFTKRRQPVENKQPSGRRASLEVPQQAKKRSDCNGMTDGSAGWRGVARSATEGTQKMSDKTANRRGIEQHSTT